MIFISLGSREYQFNRLLIKIDQLIENGILNEEIFAQIGQSDYTPKYYQYDRFISQNDFIHYQDKADIIISHGGTGSLVGALKRGKKVIAVPRLAKFGEHIDDHQLQVSSILNAEKYLIMVTDMDNLEMAISNIKNNPDLVKKYDKPSHVVEIIDSYLRDLLKGI